VKVLLAEDNIVNQRVAVGLLMRRGHDVTVAANGLETLAALDQELFDIVLMDVQMPEMGGLEATAAIREREQKSGGHIRIVAMTAHAMTGDRERCLAAGMDDYMSKPIDQQKLYAVVEGDAVAAPVAVAAAKSAVDRVELLERLGGDPELVAEVIGLFVADMPAQLAAIRSAVERRDPEALRKAAHGLKGAAGNLSAPGLVEAAHILERIGTEARMDAAEAAWRRLSAEAATVVEALRRSDAETVGVQPA
jgi:CheY-like chemotaxis protein